MTNLIKYFDYFFLIPTMLNWENVAQRSELFYPKEFVPHRIVSMAIGQVWKTTLASKAEKSHQKIGK